jgi:hypothetical protein
MEETYYAGAYWLARKESAEACAHRAETLLRLLAACDSCLAQWFETGWTREEALQNRIEPSQAAFLRRFEQQKERGPGAGFSLDVWNGQADGSSSDLSFYCGSSSIWVSSSCVLTLPHQGPIAERLLQAPVLVQVLRAMVLAWEPEWALVTSNLHRDEVLKASKAGTYPGWLMYISRRRGPVPPLPSPVHVEPVENLGTLVLLTPERFSASNPAHVALAQEVSEHLAHAGLLTPLRPWNADAPG